MRPGPSPRERAPPEALLALRALAEMGAAGEDVATSSGELARRLGVSQQTASRRILDLVERGLVRRRMGRRRQLLRLTPAGLEVLRRDDEALRVLLAEGGRRVRIRGRVVAGLGEGRWYMARRGYKDPMRRLLGFEPYEGTLNLALAPGEAEKLGELQAQEGLLVPGFEHEGRTFGAVKCFRARVGGLEAAAVLPVRGHHKDVLEVVAPVGLRGKLGLRDGDELEVEVALG